MQVNDLPIDIQNKIFYFLEHPTAAIVRGHAFDDWYTEFYSNVESQRIFVENYSLEIQLRHKLKVRYITEEEAKKLDPLFLHMNKEVIERIILDHAIIERDERNNSCDECYCELKDCQCFVLRKIFSCCDCCAHPWDVCRCVCVTCGDDYSYCKGRC